MSARPASAVVFALTVMAAAAPQNPPPQGQPTFTSSTDVVMVDVSVRKGGAMVTGLSAADFEVRDNGVKQDVETVESLAVPIDLSLMVDVSGNPDRPWSDIPLESKVAAEIDQNARKVTKLLRPGDRVRLFAVDTYLQQLWPLQAADAVPTVQHLNFDGIATFYDSLLTLLLQPVEPKRRHVIVATTRGGDGFSVAKAVEVGQIAEHSDAQIHLVMEETKADHEITVRPWQCEHMDLCRPSYRFWVPARRRLFQAQPIMSGLAPLHTLFPDGQALKAGAESTGGELYQGEMLSEPTLFGTFQKAFENFRQSYVLRYTPKGIAQPGWHQITVTVPGDKSVQIKARNGYSIDAPSAALSLTPRATAPNDLRTVADMTRAYGDDLFDIVSRMLRQTPDPARMIAEFVANGNPWPASPKREETLAIEVAEAGIYSTQPAAREQGAALLDRYRFLVRDPIAPDEFEHEWLVTTAAMLQGAIRPSVSQPFVENAIKRFPDDPRLVLARAIVSDQLWRRSGTVGTGTQLTMTTTTADHVATVTTQFEYAATFPTIHSEAVIRLSWFLHRLGRDSDALAKLQTVGPIDPSDRFLIYLYELLGGQILSALDRPTDAIAAYRRALAAVPDAQSARVSLMDALILSGDRDAAAQLAASVQAAPMAGIDPWWLYWQGDYRRYPDALQKLRGMMR